MKTGEIEPSLLALAPEYGFDLQELIDFKRANGEKCPLPAELDAQHSAAFDDLEQMLSDAHEASERPETSPNKDGVQAWLIEQRLAAL